LERKIRDDLHTIVGGVSSSVGKTIETIKKTVENESNNVSLI
jgi:hypothetical protein